MGSAWYITSATDPTRRLGGPYATRDECERACLAMTDTRSTVQAFSEGRLPGYYVPRPFKEDNNRARSADELLRERSTERTSIAYSSGTDRAYVSTTANEFDSRPSPPVSKSRKPKIKLPDNIYRFERAELLELAEALGMNKSQLVALKPNKHELVAIMEAYLNSVDDD